jgi:hypothetical protein
MLIKNPKGMTARLFALATTKADDIALLSIVGAITEVKAIWASTLRTNANLHLLPRSRRIHGHPDLHYLTHKSTIAPGIHHWTLYPEPDPDAPFLLILDHPEILVHIYLTRILNHHTLWPIREEWADLLWQNGLHHKLITRLHTIGNLDSAYAVNTLGWDDLLDQLAQANQLTFS